MLDFGISKQTFFDELHEKRPFIQRGGYAALAVGWDEVDRALFVGENTDANLRVHKGGVIDEAKYTELCSDLGVVRKRIIKAELAKLLEDGASIIYNRMEGVSVPIRDLCNQVARFTGAPAAANGYISFGDKETFGNHWDTHDVFAVQLIGRKRWLVYEPTFSLPLPGQTSLHHKADCPATPFFDEILEAGDILYIPRGWWHTAIPLREETFHVAIGVHPPVVANYVEWVAKNVLPDHFSCRHSIHANEQSRHIIAAAKETLLEVLFSDETFSAYQTQLVRNERTASAFDIARPFRADAYDELEQSRFILHSRFDGRAIFKARTINGRASLRTPHGQAVTESIANATQPISFQALQAAHPAIKHEALLWTLNDLLLRDIIGKHARAPLTHAVAQAQP
ncbi:JmjC domain-containing protein [Pseudoduganella sp. R-34]|uniref:JmjC domain-containing protein n=1 Tax=Pseudoduganella sp. R-34 TaxID=3404062 RepID=UPI003CF37845